MFLCKVVYRSLFNQDKVKEVLALLIIVDAVNISVVEMQEIACKNKLSQLWFQDCFNNYGIIVKV